ncbi:MAG TPA: SIS domain-containing protein [Vicinamibacteria bacterium]|nr:SIS domain-containing protein [Vicinamibacteria bacterium]
MQPVESEVGLRERVRRKARESARTIEAFFEREADRVVECCRVLAEALDNGGRLFVMGNGGSACDAQHLAVEFTHPVVAKRRAFPATALVNDIAWLTATGNDDDFAVAFAEQLRLLARSGDIVIGLSTSGQSANVNRALRVARDMELRTVGIAGKDGGRLKDVCDYLFVVPSYSIHRIQETQGVLLHVMWDLIHIGRGEEDVL